MKKMLIIIGILAVLLVGCEKLILPKPTRNQKMMEFIIHIIK